MIFSNLWGVLLFSEAITLVGCVGAALVAAGVLTAVVATKKPAAGSRGEGDAKADRPDVEGAERMLATSSQGGSDLDGSCAYDVQLSLAGRGASGDGDGCKAGTIELQSVQGVGNQGRL